MHNPGGFLSDSGRACLYRSHPTCRRETGMMWVDKYVQTYEIKPYGHASHESPSVTAHQWVPLVVLDQKRCSAYCCTGVTVLLQVSGSAMAPRGLRNQAHPLLLLAQQKETCDTCAVARVQDQVISQLVIHRLRADSAIGQRPSPSSFTLHTCAYCGA